MQLNLINLKMFCLTKKLLDIKWKELKVKKKKLGTYEIDKISLSCFDDKRYVLHDGIYTFYFHKNGVKSCNNLWLYYWWLLMIIWWLLMIVDDYCWLLMIYWWLLKKIARKQNVVVYIRRLLGHFFFFFFLR